MTLIRILKKLVKKRMCIWWDNNIIEPSTWNYSPSPASLSIWNHSIGKIYPNTVFLSIAFCLTKQHFTSYKGIKNWVDSLIASKYEDFSQCNICLVPKRWKKYCLTILLMKHKVLFSFLYLDYLAKSYLKKLWVGFLSGKNQWLFFFQRTDLLIVLNTLKAIK